MCIHVLVVVLKLYMYTVVYIHVFLFLFFSCLSHVPVRVNCYMFAVFVLLVA